jgi:hypothetical protein
VLGAQNSYAIVDAGVIYMLREDYNVACRLAAAFPSEIPACTLAHVPVDSTLPAIIERMARLDIFAGVRARELFVNVFAWDALFHKSSNHGATVLKSPAEVSRLREELIVIVGCFTLQLPSDVLQRNRGSEHRDRPTGQTPASVWLDKAMAHQVVRFFITFLALQSTSRIYSGMT